MHDCDVWYHVYPLGFLGAEPVNPAPDGNWDALTFRLPQLVDWLDYLVGSGITALLLGPVFESETHSRRTHNPA